MAQTIPGGGGSVITFSVSGSAGGNYAADFAGAVAAGHPVGTLPDETTVAGALFVYESGNPLNTVLTTGSQYFYVDSGAANFITLAASNETLLAGDVTTVIEQGSVGGERVIFSSGDNLFTGSSTGVGGDTISGGSGFDTIDTGAGPTTVFSGANTSITLNDTSAGGGDLVSMLTGNTTVYAAGVSDTVYAAATGTIYGGPGALTLTTDAGTVTVEGGMGTVTGYLTAGSDITFSSPMGSAPATFIAATGNETLNGADANGGFSFFADQSGSVNDSVTGGTGNDYFSTGAGTEDYYAGAGAANFEINDVGGTITINDFGAGDSVNFAGMSVADETSLIGSSSTVSDGSLTVTLTGGTTVEFVGVTSLSGHLN